jgi:hypothetical protein
MSAMNVHELNSIQSKSLFCDLALNDCLMGDLKSFSTMLAIILHSVAVLEAAPMKLDVKVEGNRKARTVIYEADRDVMRRGKAEDKLKTVVESRRFVERV